MKRTMLILGAFNEGSIENFYVSGLEKCGVLVSKNDIVNPCLSLVNKSFVNRVRNKVAPEIFYKVINNSLLAFLEKEKFDIILVFKGMELFPETVQQLKRHAGVLANYNGDHPFKFYSPGSGNDNVLHSIPYYDVHFSYAKAIVRELKDKYNKEAHCIPFGFNSNLNHSPSPAIDNYAEKFLFIGTFDNERASYLNKVIGPSIEIYGDVKWKTRNWFRPRVQHAFKGRKLYNSEFAGAISSASGIINLLRKQNIREDSHNMRTFEVPGYGGLLISQRTTEQQEYFESDKEAIYFDSLDELKSKVEYLQSSPSIVNTIKRNAYSRSITSGYSYDNRCKQMMASL